LASIFEGFDHLIECFQKRLVLPRCERHQRYCAVVAQRAVIILPLFPSSSEPTQIPAIHEIIHYVNEWICCPRLEQFQLFLDSFFLTIRTSTRPANASKDFLIRKTTGAPAK